MAAKEQRELGRRTMLKFHKYRAPSDKLDSYSSGRLPALPPRSAHDTLRPPTEPQLSSTHERSKLRQMSPSILEMSGKNKDCGGPSKNTLAEIKEDIREGLHVVILHEAASEEPHTKRMAAAVACDMAQTAEDIEKPHLPRKDEALRIYKKYQELHMLDAAGGDEEHSDHNEDENEEEDWSKTQCHESRLTAALEDGMAAELLPISWPTFFAWVQREYDFASHFRIKAAVSALMRAVKRWKQWQATPSQHFYGVSLNMMLQWAFPGLIYQDLAEILIWIAKYELEQIRQETPRVIEAQDRRQLEGIFNALDVKGKGFCTAEDIAGGSVQDVSQRLKNIVDADTVRNVCGDGGVSQDAFLELFCVDNCRAHQDSKQAILEDGSQLVHVEHPVVGFSGWVFKDPPKKEESARSLIRAIEAEVLKWKKLAACRKTKLTDVQSTFS